MREERATRIVYIIGQEIAVDSTVANDAETQAKNWQPGGPTSRRSCATSLTSRRCATGERHCLAIQAASTLIVGAPLELCF
jgi:hypothetical protein